MKKLLVFSILAFALIYAFSSESGTAQRVECLGSFEEFLYLGDSPYPDANPAPLPPWKFEVTVQADPYTDYSDVEVERIHGGATEIWTFVAEADYLLEDPIEIVVYYPATGDKTTISTKTNLEGVQVDRLFVDHTGAIWGRNRWGWPIDARPSTEEIPVLSKFDETSRSFVAVENGPRLRLEEDYWQVLETDLPQIDMEDQAVFWIFIQEDGLYKFDASSFQTVKVLHFPELTVLPLHSGANGKVYFQSFGYEFRVYEYSYLDNRLEEVVFPASGWRGSGSILVDRNNNLWLSGFGWRNPMREWYPLHPRATEVLMNSESFTLEELYSPRVTYESSNGWLWFAKYKEFDNGTAWLNPDTGEGCWFTTLSKQVIEDNEGRMWMTANGNLYSLDLYP